MPVRSPATGAKEVRYDAPGPLNPISARGTNGGNNQGPGNGHNPAAGNTPLHETTGLRTLLKNLRNGHDYPPQNLWLDVPARGTGVGAAVRATDYFRKFEDFTQTTAADDITRAYWGEVTSVGEGSEGKGKETLFIRCDARGPLVVIKLEYQVKDALIKALGIIKSDQLRKAHVIVEGITKQGPRKLFVPVTDINKTAFLPPRT